MMRYIKVNGRWIDTLIQQKDFEEIYCIYNKNVYMYHEADALSEPAILVGVLEDEKESI